MDQQFLSDLIGRIYDCALDPTLWPETIGRIGAAVGARAGFILVHDFKDNFGSRLFDHGLTEERVHRYFEHYAPINPIARAGGGKIVGEVDTLRSMFKGDEWENSAFNREWIRPQGLRDVMGMVVLRNRRRAAWLGNLRDESLPDFADAEVALLRLLSPHVCRAMRIVDVLDVRTVAAARLSETIDALTTAVFLLDATGRVVHRNEAAERLTDLGEVLQMRQGRLTAPHLATAGALTAAIDRMLTGEAELPLSPHAIALGDLARGSPMLGTLLPLRRHGAPLHPYAAAAALFVQDPAAGPPPVSEAFAALYGLTPAELRFLAALVAAPSVGGAAAALGIAQSTGRSHLKAIFEKTGTARQAELTQLLMASRTPVRGSGGMG